MDLVCRTRVPPSVGHSEKQLLKRLPADASKSATVFFGVSVGSKWHTNRTFKAKIILVVLKIQTSKQEGTYTAQ